MNSSFKKIQGEVSPFVFTSFIVIIMIIMTLFVLFFEGQFIETLGQNGKEELRDYCSLDVSLVFEKICSEDNYLEVSVRNNGNIQIDSFVFESVEYLNNAVTSSNQDLSPGEAIVYDVIANEISQVQKISLTPKLKIDNEYIDCTPIVRSIYGGIDPCVQSSGSGGSSSSSGGGGSSGGNDNPPPSGINCVDEDGDGYNVTGGECGPIDCDDSDETVYYMQDFYLDGDGDGYGFGDVASSICWGDEGYHLTPILGHSFNNLDCDDSDETVYYMQDFYVDEDGDGYGFGDVASSICWGDEGYHLTPILGHSFNNLDCDDSDISVNPGEEENCSDDVDHNCDGDPCIDCSIALPVFENGCRCQEVIYYHGFCCSYGWSKSECSEGGQDLVPEEPLFSKFFSWFEPLIKLFYY